MNIASYIDHTLLKADATKEDIRQLCREAVEHGFASVCVNGCHVPLCAELLKDTPVKVCTVCGFPLGASSSAAKAAEAYTLVSSGAQEIDMVINIGRVKDGEFDYILRDIGAVVAVCHPKAIVKVILETCLLTDDEIIACCLAAEKAGADFVKTSTGFSTGGATEHAVSVIKSCVGERMGVKASGGIRTLRQAELMLSCGATRLGTSSGVAIVSE